MDGFEVEIAEVRAAGTRADASAQQAEGVDLAARVSGVESALPGSTAGPQARALASAWREELDTWVAAVDAHGAGLTSSADGYARHEAAAARTFTGSR